jgi:hypothetical protein
VSIKNPSSNGWAVYFLFVEGYNGEKIEVFLVDCQPDRTGTGQSESNP